MSKRAQNQYERFSQVDVQICIKKHRFGSKNAARDHSSRQELNLEPYKCPICRNWHLTSIAPEYQGAVKETIRNRMTQPPAINTSPRAGTLRRKLNLREMDGFRVGETVRTPSGRPVRVVGFVGFGRDTKGGARVICKYLDRQPGDDKNWLMEVTLLPSLLTKVKEEDRGA